MTSKDAAKLEASIEFTGAFLAICLAPTGYQVMMAAFFIMMVIIRTLNDERLSNA